MLQLLLELAPCLLCGMALGRVSPQLPQRLAPVLLRWGVPISLVGLLLKGGVHSGNLQAAPRQQALAAGALRDQQATSCEHQAEQGRLQVAAVNASLEQ